MDTIPCPHCDCAIPITWARYWRSSAPWGFYRCPECGGGSRITTSPRWIQDASHLVQIFVPLTFVPVFGSEHVMWLVPVLTAIFLIDRKLDGWYGILVPIEPEDGVKATENQQPNE